MACWTTYRLKPKDGAGFHFGLRGLEGEESAAYCPSDTLFAALVATAADMGGAKMANAFAAPFAAGKPPYLLTSAYPAAGELHLFPMPHRKLNLQEKQGQRKLLKRLQYLSPKMFAKALRFEPVDEYLSEDGSGRFLQDGRVWLTQEEQLLLPETWRKLPDDKLREQSVWKAAPVDRVTVDRTSSASAVFRIGRTVYAPDCGLWFGVQWPGAPQPADRDTLEELLALMGDCGLGGERSVGYGQFTWEPGAALDLPAARAGQPALSLSRYLPDSAELPAALQGEHSSYRLVAVAGWLAAPGRAAQRRRQVRLLAEGAVFQTIGTGPWGRLADARPVGWTAHPIWRYGYACPVGLAGEGDKNE